MQHVVPESGPSELTTSFHPLYKLSARCFSKVGGGSGIQLRTYSNSDAHCRGSSITCTESVFGDQWNQTGTVPAKVVYWQDISQARRTFKSLQKRDKSQVKTHLASSTKVFVLADVEVCNISLLIVALGIFAL